MKKEYSGYALIVAQAVRLARIENKRREEERATRPADWMPSIIGFDELAASALDPRPYTFQRAWAQLACLHLNEKSWESFVWSVSDEVKSFDGDIIGWLENLFDGMQLSDGTTVWR